MLEGSPIGPDRDRTGAQPVGRVVSLVPAATSRQLRAACRTASTTSFALASSLTAMALNRLTGSTDIALSGIASVRPQPELDAIIGMFANTFVFRVPIDPERSVGGLVEGVRDRVAATLEHVAAPFALVAGRLHHTLGTPLDRVVQALVLSSEGGSFPWRFGELTVEPAGLSRAQPGPMILASDLMIELDAQRGRTRLLSTFKRSRYPRDQARALRQHLGALAAALATRAGDSLSSIC
jgi:non-ribosomal peptide synthetase component F